MSKPPTIKTVNAFYVKAFREERLLKALIRKYPVLAETELRLYNMEIVQMFKNSAPTKPKKLEDLKRGKNVRHRQAHRGRNA